MKKRIGSVMILICTLLYFSCNKKDYGHTKPYSPISEERSIMHELFKQILCDTDQLNANKTSLDTVLLTSLQCEKDNLLENCDSVYLDILNANFWIKIGDTLFLQNKRIIFSSDPILNQLELSHKDTGDYPYLEFYTTFYGDKSTCCLNARVNTLDTVAKIINFSMPAFGEEIRFELDYNY